MRKRLLVLASLALVASACGDTAVSSTAAPATAPDATTAPGTTQPPASTAPVVESTTTEVAPTDAAPPANAAPAFAITQVSFGDGAFVQITNTGNGAGDLGGYWLCQRPVYFEVPSTELAPGESVWVAADGGDLQFVGAVVGVVDAGGRIGSLSVASGEIALYRRNDFGSPEAIVDYVEWGTAGHGRSGTAVEAGIWPAGGFVDTADNTIAISAEGPDANGPDDWAADLGV